MSGCVCEGPYRPQPGQGVPVRVMPQSPWGADLLLLLLFPSCETIITGSMCQRVQNIVSIILSGG